MIYETLRHVADVEHPVKVPEGFNLIGKFDGKYLAVDRIGVHYIYQNEDWNLQDK